MQSIESLAANAKMINWSDTVKENIRKLQTIRFKAEAERKLPGLKQELVQVQKKLAELKKRNSLFDAFKLDTLNLERSG